jgi:uncharacterized protein YecT (DUF1311 family)
MNAGSNMPRRRVLFGAMAFAAGASAWAIDNPDGPDRTAQFLTRARPFEQRVSDAASDRAVAVAQSEYAKFLDGELNQSYRELLGHLDAGAKAALVDSQRAWLQFRDSEGRFIDRNWVPENFGSSSAMSRADYRAALVKQRILSLLAYLQNYPSKSR